MARGHAGTYCGSGPLSEGLYRSIQASGMGSRTALSSRRLMTAALQLPKWLRALHRCAPPVAAEIAPPHCDSDWLRRTGPRSAVRDDMMP